MIECLDSYGGWWVPYLPELPQVDTFDKFMDWLWSRRLETAPTLSELIEVPIGMSYLRTFSTRAVSNATGDEVLDILVGDLVEAFILAHHYVSEQLPYPEQALFRVRPSGTKSEFWLDVIIHIPGKSEARA